MFLLNGKPLALDVPFTTEDGTQYPANWLRFASAEEKQAIGVTEAPEPEGYDDRFYWGVGNPKDLEQLKTQMIAQVKTTAGTLLAPTDWMVLRQLSKGVGMSHIYEDYRTAVVDYSNTLETAINACTTVEELAAVQITWPTVEQ